VCSQAILLTCEPLWVMRLKERKESGGPGKWQRWNGAITCSLFSHHLPSFPRGPKAGKNVSVRSSPGSLKSSEVTLLWRPEVTVMMLQWSWFPWSIGTTRDAKSTTSLISHGAGVSQGFTCRNLRQWLIERQSPRNELNRQLTKLLLYTERQISALLDRDQLAPS
jgi:hypothetical protein